MRASLPGRLNSSGRLRRPGLPAQTNSSFLYLMNHLIELLLMMAVIAFVVITFRYFGKTDE